MATACRANFISTSNLSYIYDALLWLKTTLSGTKSMRKQICGPRGGQQMMINGVFAVLIAVLYNQHIWQIHNFFWTVYEFFKSLSLGRSCKRRGNGWNRHMMKGATCSFTLPSIDHAWWEIYVSLTDSLCACRQQEFLNKVLSIIWWFIC